MLKLSAATVHWTGLRGVEDDFCACAAEQMMADRDREVSF